MGRSRRTGKAAGVSLGVKYPTFIMVALVLMFVAVIYVGLHLRMTRLEYETAAALSARELLQEQQKKLELELAMLKAPRRIEEIARTKLKMSYPTAEQVIVIKQARE